MKPAKVTFGSASGQGLTSGGVGMVPGTGPSADVVPPFNTSTFSGAWTGIQTRMPYRDANRGASWSVFGGLSSGQRAITISRREAVANARDLDRNNPMVHANLTKRATNLVGANLKFRSMPQFDALGLDSDWGEEFSSQVEMLFSLWAEDPRNHCDAARHSQFGGLMLEGARNAFGADGEVGGIIRFDLGRKKKLRARFGTFVELIDTDRISNQYNAADTATLCQGRALDQWGGMEGIWVEDRDPSDRQALPNWVYVPRESAKGRPIAFHWFPKFRAQVQRGMPSFISAISSIKGLENVDKYTLKQAAMAAFMSMYIKTDANSADALAKLQQQAPTGTPLTWDSLQSARFGLYENMLQLDGQPFPVLAQGDDIGISESTHAAIDNSAFRYVHERLLAAVNGLSYANSSNDYSKTSFASIRAEFIDMWRLVHADRYQFTQNTGSLCVMALIEEAIAYGDIVLPPGAPDFYDNMGAYCAGEFTGPAMGWVDPVKDVQGAGMRISSGLSSPQKEAAAAGEDWRDIIDATAIYQAYCKRKGVTITYGAITDQVREDETLGADGEPVDPNAGTGGTGSSDPAPSNEPAPAPKPAPAPAPKGK